MTKIVRENGISAEVVAISESPSGKKLITVNVKYGLFIHAEFLRHRLLSRGVKSNRAIPTKVIRKEVLQDPYIPVWFGANKPGMVSSSEVRFKGLAKRLWLLGRFPVVGLHWLGEKLLGGHKEWLNRMLNPWQWVRETITATEWQNLYDLRLHGAAQRDIKEVVDAVKTAIDIHVAVKGCDDVYPDEYHVPYIHKKQLLGGQWCYGAIDNIPELTTEEAIKCSVARCARSSYDKHDGGKSTVEEDINLYNNLIESKPTHGSPAEHVATPMLYPTLKEFEESGESEWPEGYTHVDREGNFWSGNLKGWVQHRQTLKDHVSW